MNGLHVKHTDLHTNKNTCSLADKVDYKNSCTAISMICLPHGLVNVAFITND